MKQAVRSLVCLMALAGLWLGTASPILAHGGGTPRLTSAPAGPYRVYAWTEPEPWRAGEVHLSVAVTLPADAAAQADGAQVEEPVTDVAIQVTFTPEDGSSPPIVMQATRQAVLGDYYFEADTILPAEGLWRMEIAVEGEAGGGTTGFSLQALPPRTINWSLVGAAGAVLLVIIALIGLWSRKQPAPPSQRPIRRAAGRPAR